LDYEQVKKKVLSGFAWQGSTKVLMQAFSWATTVIVARLLSPGDYGIVAIAGVFIGILTLITEMGLSEGLINKEHISPEERDSIFWFSLLLGAGMYAVLFLAAPFIAAIYKMEVLTAIMRVSGLTLLLASLRVVPLAVAMRRMDFRYFSLVELAAAITATVTVVSLAFLGHGAWSLVWGLLASKTVAVLAYLPLLGAFPKWRMDLHQIRATVVFGTKLMAANIMSSSWREAPVVIIGLILGQSAAGYYTMANQFAQIPLNKLGSIFNTIAFPATSRLKHQKTEAASLFLRLHRYLLMVTFPLLLGLTVVAEDVIVFLLSDKWAPVVPVLQILCVANLLRVSMMLLLPVLKGCGNADRILQFHLAACIIMPIGYVAGAQFGIVGVAAAWLVAFPGLYLFLAYSLIRELEISFHDFAGSVRAGLAASTIMVLTVFTFQALSADYETLVRLVVSILLGMAVYFLALVILHGDDLRQLKRILLTR
jgi:O-antigen/teichoic acid export membrane protein